MPLTVQAFGVDLDTGTWDARVADAVGGSGLSGVSAADLDGATGWGRNASLAAAGVDPAVLCDGRCSA